MELKVVKNKLFVVDVYWQLSYAILEEFLIKSIAIVTVSTRIGQRLSERPFSFGYFVAAYALIYIDVHCRTLIYYVRMEPHVGSMLI